MPDIFDTIQPEVKGDIFDHISMSPSDSSNDMQDAKWGVQHPILRALQNTASQSVVNPVAQAVNALEPAVKGIYKGVGVPDEKNNISPVNTPDMSNAPFAAKVLGDVAGGGAKAMGAVAAGRGNPFVGYGALAGLEAYGKDQPVIPAMAQGVVSAVPQVVAGKLGSTLASAAAKPFGGIVSQYAPKVGTAAGMGGISAAMAPEGEKLRSAATGATFGLMSPMNPIGAPKQVTQAQHDEIVAKEASIMRNVLNPGKGEIDKVEVKSGKNIDDFMENAVRKGLIIDKDSTGTKLDTSTARQQLENHNAPIYSQIDQELASNPDKQFNLDDIATKAKKSFDDPNSPLYQKNAAAASAAKAKIQNEIDAEIMRHGSDVNGETLNKIKQGMWSKSYNPLEPNANDGARQIGYVAKDAIEQAYPNSTIKELNQELGKNLTLTKLLERAHGRIIQAGKIGKYAAQGIGALTGHASHIPGAEIIGGWTAGKVSAMMNDPVRITKGIADRLNNLQITNPTAQTSTRPGIVNPQIINPVNGVSMSPVGGALPSPLPAYLQARQNIPSMNVPTGNAVSSNPIPMGGTVIRGLPSPQQETPLPPYLQERQNIPQEPIALQRPEIPYTPGPEAVIHPKPQENIQGPMSEFNPYKNPQQGLTNEQGQGTNLANNKGSLAPGEKMVTIRSDKPGYNLRQGKLIKTLRNGDVIVEFGKGDQMRFSKGEIDFGDQNMKNKMLGIMGTGALATGLALGSGSMFNPINAQAAQPKDQERLHLPAAQYTQKEEGFQSNPYMDTQGNKTIGYGFNMNEPSVLKLIPQAVLDHKRSLTKDEANNIFNQLYSTAQLNAQKFSGERWSMLNDNQRKALTDMSYQLGSAKLNGFKNLKEAIKGGHFNTAAREILNSNYKKQAKNRALRNSMLIQG